MNMIDRIDKSVPMNELPTWLQELWELKPYIARQAEKNYLDLLKQVKNNNLLNSAIQNIDCYKCGSKNLKPTEYKCNDCGHNGYYD